MMRCLCRLLRRQSEKCTSELNTKKTHEKATELLNSHLSLKVKSTLLIHLEKVQLEAKVPLKLSNVSYIQSL